MKKLLLFSFTSLVLGFSQSSCLNQKVTTQLNDKTINVAKKQNEYVGNNTKIEGQKNIVHSSNSFVSGNQNNILVDNNLVMGNNNIIRKQILGNQTNDKAKINQRYKISQQRRQNNNNFIVGNNNNQYQIYNKYGSEIKALKIANRQSQTLQSYQTRNINILENANSIESKGLPIDYSSIKSLEPLMIKKLPANSKSSNPFSQLNSKSQEPKQSSESSDLSSLRNNIQSSINKTVEDSLLITENNNKDNFQLNKNIKTINKNNLIIDKTSNLSDVKINQNLNQKSTANQLLTKSISSDLKTSVNIEPFKNYSPGIQQSSLPACMIENNNQIDCVIPEQNEQVANNIELTQPLLQNNSLTSTPYMLKQSSFKKASKKFKKQMQKIPEYLNEAKGKIKSKSTEIAKKISQTKITNQNTLGTIGKNLAKSYPMQIDKRWKPRYHNEMSHWSRKQFDSFCNKNYDPCSKCRNFKYPHQWNNIRPLPPNQISLPHETLNIIENNENKQ